MNNDAPTGYWRLDKRDARKYYNCGHAIYLVPVKMRFDPNYPFSMAIIISLEKRNGRDFDAIINEYEYYNCNSETGYKAKFFIKREDKETKEMCDTMCN